MTKAQGSVFSLVVVSAFFYFVYRVAIKGRPLSFNVGIPTPIPGVEQVVHVPVTKEPIP